MDEIFETVDTAETETKAAARYSKKKAKKSFFKKITENKSLGGLIIKSVVMLVVPYAYLFLCGLIDSWLITAGYRFREAFILFVFFTLMAAWIAAVVLIVLSIIKWVKRKK